MIICPADIIASCCFSHVFLPCVLPSTCVFVVNPCLAFHFLTSEWKPCISCEYQALLTCFSAPHLLSSLLSPPVLHDEWEAGQRHPDCTQHLGSGKVQKFKWGSDFAFLPIQVRVVWGTKSKILMASYITCEFIIIKSIQGTDLIRLSRHNKTGKAPPLKSWMDEFLPFNKISYWHLCGVNWITYTGTGGTLLSPCGT